MSVCIALGEYPTIRYYRPPAPPPSHEAHVLSSYIADAVQLEIDTYAKWNDDFEPSDSRPRGSLYILDRSMDLAAPFLHEFTYQAMAHDLLPIRENDKITYSVTTNKGQPNEETKDVEISEKDSIWVQYRHMHMSQTLVRLDQDFKAFLSKNRNFAERDKEVNVGDLKDLLAGMSEFHAGKDAYSLHTTMAEECMDMFERCKLPELAGLEQVCDAISKITQLMA
jgi:syntaxin-binding protein 1